MQTSRHPGRDEKRGRARLRMKIVQGMEIPVVERQRPNRALALVNAAALVGIGMGYHAASLAGEARILEEIVVTAQKRAENLQDVPFTVTAVSGTDLEKFHIDNLESLNGVVPNILFAHPPNGQLTLVPTIRGIGITTNPSAYAGTEVAIVVDGVIQGTRRNGLLNNFDIERIEVLKGPQGTLFGADTLAGVVNITTRQPTGEFGVYGRATTGNYNEQSGFVAVDFPILEGVLAGKVSVASWDREGFYTNLYDGEDLMSLDATQARGYLLWTPSDDFEASLKVGQSKARQGGQVVINRSRPEQLLYRPGLSDRDIDFKAYNDSPVNNKVDSYFGTLTINWESPIGLFTSITSYTEAESEGVQDTDGTAEFILNAGVGADDQQYSQEFRLDLQPTPNLQATLGVFYKKLEFSEDVRSIFNMSSPAALSEQLVDSEDEAMAVFAQGYYDLTSRLRLGLGMRYSRKEISLSAFNRTLLVDDPHPYFYEQNVRNGIPAGSFGTNGKETWKEPSGKVSLDYAITPDVSIYAYYAHGFKSGGFNGRISVPEDLGPFEPEFIDAYEIGVKSELFDRRLRLNAAAFYNDWQDMQVPQSVYRGTQTSSTILNAAEATSKGAEVSVEFVPTGSLQVVANVGYVDATYDKFVESGVDYSGNEMPFAPHWTGSFSISNDWQVGQGTISSSLQYSYLGLRWGSFTHLSSERMKAVGLVDANLSWTAPGGRWSVELWGRNLSNEKYVASALSVEPLFTEASYGEPRRYGVDLRFEF